MNTHNEALQNSLRCLQHPFSLISIVILLLNDHVFKIIAPSWITGKLSDFAGLFFFPFIVSVLLSALLSGTKITSRRVGQVTFSFVAIWFGLIKTIPSINLLTSDLASLLLKGTTQIVLDPMDLIALLVMFPAWKLWNQPQQARTSIRLAYVGLVIGAFAVIATSPIEWTVTNVTDLVYSEDGTIYAADRKTFGQESYPIAKSLDGGLTWEDASEKDSLPNLHDKKYPILVCNNNSNILNQNCYRVTSDHQLQRYWNESWVKVFPPDVSVRAYDIIIFAIERDTMMLVAIGEAGVMRLDLPNGNWEIIRVMNAGSQ